ncbi:MAG TPA: phospholipase D family protein [Actinomycetota bacterium]|nr:phospholipase D family protein [Actinomycetota bacterium]
MKSSLEDWFLTPDERGNPSTEIDRRRLNESAYTEGNLVRVLVHGATYFKSLYEELKNLGPDDWVHFTDWEGDPDEQLVGPGTEVGKVLADLARRRVHVRGLLWRSHPRQAHFSEQQNVKLVREVNEAGGEILLDERVRRGGSHHQKLFVLRRASGPPGAGADVAFVGGIDLAYGRRDDASHEGDTQAGKINPKYGERPPWHDVQLEVRGPAVGDLAHTFRERWEDSTPLDHRNPLRFVLRRLTRQPRRPDPLPPVQADPLPQGPHAVQVVRTYPAKRPPYPFASEGERSIARAYLKALDRARRLIYVEDQYLWSELTNQAFVEALRRSRELHLIIVVPRFPERGGKVAGSSETIGRLQFLDKLVAAGGKRVAVYDLENVHGTPIYIHAKVCVVDDVWLEVGSDNINRRSWTHDSELSCAILDSTVDGREPTDPAGLGDKARRLARDTRLELWREHLGRREGEDHDLIDPVSGFEAWRTAAGALDEWHLQGREGPRPPGHARLHRPEAVPWHSRWWAKAIHNQFVDPDGRPRSLRRTNQI